jgi:hypothetical protein
MGELTRVFVDGREIAVNSVVLIGERTRRTVMLVVNDLLAGGWRSSTVMPPDVPEGPWRGYGA